MKDVAHRIPGVANDVSLSLEIRRGLGFRRVWSGSQEANKTPDGLIRFDTLFEQQRRITRLSLAFSSLGFFVDGILFSRNRW